jgi:hypothetical protein
MPKLVEHPGDGDLVLNRKIDARRLLAVAAGWCRTGRYALYSSLHSKIVGGIHQPKNPVSGQEFPPPRKPGFKWHDFGGKAPQWFHGLIPN